MANVRITGLQDVITDIRARPSLIARKLMVAADRHLTLGSPVDTGRFRANWFPSTEVPDLQQIPEGEYSPPKPKTTDDWSENAVRYYLSNGMVYAVPLAEGHSAQADPGWVPEALRAAAKEIST